MITATSTSILPDVSRDWPRQVVSLAMALVASVTVFTGLSRVHSVATPEPPPAIEDLREVVLPVEAPPPPPVRSQEVSEVVASNLVVVEGGRTESVVKLAALPSVPETPPRVLGVPRIDYSVTEMKPASLDTEIDTRRVFERSDVDQPCVPLEMVRPRAARFMLKEARDLRVTYLFIVNRDGSVEGLRLLHSSGSIYVDKACAEALAEWKFAPAIRKGHTVRQWAQQSIVFVLEGGNPFEAN